MSSVEQPISNARRRAQRYAVWGMTLVLLMMGIFALIFLHTNRLIRQRLENVTFMAELNDDATREDIQTLSHNLEISRFIRKGTIHIVTRRQAIEQLKSEFGNVEELMDTSILPNSVQFNIKANYLNDTDLGSGSPQDTAGIIGDIQKYPFVKAVYYQKIVTDNIKNNLHKIGWGVLALGIIFSLVAILLIDNTVRLTLYADRFLIRNMQLVGATRDFIIQPYVKEGAKRGLISAAIALLVLLSLTGLVLSFSRDFNAALDWLEWSGVALFLLLLGAGLGAFSTRLGVSKYLSMKLDDLY